MRREWWTKKDEERKRGGRMKVRSERVGNLQEVGKILTKILNLNLSVY